MNSRFAKPPQFSIAAVLALTALTALDLAAWRANPPAGGLLLALLLPALIRTMVAVHWQKSRAGWPTVRDTVVLFLNSMILAVVAYLAAFTVAFFAAAIAIQLAEINALRANRLAELVAVGAVVAAALSAFTWVMWSTRPGTRYDLL